MKKILLAILLLAASFKLYAGPHDPYKVGSLWYKIPDNHLFSERIVIVTTPAYQSYGTYAKPTGDLVIPETVMFQGYQCTVVGIDAYAFRECYGLHSVSVPYSVTSIGARAFYYCTGLDSLYIGSGVSSVASDAFYECTNLRVLYYDAQNCSSSIIHSANLGNLIIGDSVRTIPGGAFSDCTGISTVIIPDDVISIGNNAFSGCSSIDSLHIGSGALTIGSYAFANCIGLNTVIIPDSVTNIGNYAFSGCSGIDSLHIGSGALTIGSYAFANCIGLNTVIIPDSVTNIGNYAFSGCSGIDSLHIGSGVLTIGSNAFANCADLNTVIIPKSVTSIGSEAFSGCFGITSLYIGNGVLTIGDSAFANCTGLYKVIIPDSVTSIGRKAFSGCSNIDSLFVGNNLTNIGINILSGCIGLKYLYYNAINSNDALFTDNTNMELLNALVIGEDVRYIPANAFQNRTSIHSVNIPDGVIGLGNNVFSGCTGIDSLFIGCNLQNLGMSVLSGCTGLKYLYYNARNCDFALFTDNTTMAQFNTLVIGDSVKSLPASAFQNRTIIHRIVIPDNVTSLGANLFYGCIGIDSIFVGCGLQNIDTGVLSGCVGLKYLYYNARNCNDALFMDNTDMPLFSKLEVGDSVTNIPSNVFLNRTELDSIVIGSGVQYIGAGAFSGCTGLKYMYYNARNCNDALFASGNNTPFANTNTPLFNTLFIGDSVNFIPANAFYNRSSIINLQIGSNVQAIGSSAFRGCAGINQLFIPDGILSIGDNAFYGCSGIDSLRISNGMTAIGNGVFQGCSNIQNLVIPNGIASIGNNAFRGCTGIDNISLGSGVVSIGNSAFQGCTGFSKLLLPESVTSIGSNAFYGCTNIDSLYIGSNVQTIGSGAFRGCTGLTWLNYNAPNLPAQGFYGCTQLATLILGNNVQSIGSEAFYNCDNLLSANISANQIGSNAFANCDRLVTVTLGESTSTIGDGVFSGCFRLQNIDLGGVTTIGSNAFSGCVRLERPELPLNLTTIGAYAFNNCSLLSGKLTFPATITSIGDYAYNGVGTITEIEMLGANPPTIYAHTFASVSSSTPVSVPCGAVLNYYTTNYWENFSTIVEAPPYKLTVATNNEVMGSAAVSQQPTCSNHSAIIQATAETGFHFIQWNDGNGTNPRTVNMTQDSTFTAIFVPNNSQVTVEPNNPLMGTTTGSGTYGYNAPVTMTATAYDGYHFLKWNDGNTQNPRYMAAVRDTTFTAIFVSNVSTITVSNANPDWGNVSGSGVYYYMNLVSLTATPVYGYHFSRWNDGNTLNPRTITVNQDSSFTAYFAVNTYSIVGSSNSTAMGSVSGGGTYTYLHEMSLTATPAFGYHFVQWNDQNTDNPRTITVTRDSAFTAQFAANSYTLTAEPNDPTMGSAYGSGTYNFNTTATLTAVAEYGYHFTQWSDGVTDNPRSVTVQNSATYTAQFEINSYILTVQSSNPAIGTTSGGGSYNYLTTVNITANPNAGYHFTQWSDGNTDNPRLVTVTQNATYTAQFAINSYAVGVTSSNTNMGSVSGSGTYNHNSTATLTATPYYGYHFVQWQDGNTENPRSVVVTDSAQFTAQFDYNSYLVTANSSNVTLGSATGGGSYNYLSQVALTAVAVPHYHFTMWNDSIEDNPRTIIVTRDTMFTAHFAIDRHTVGVHTADATQGTVNGSDTVDYNTAVWISATANYGYHFTHWQDGNTSNPRRVVVSQDVVYTASFAPNQYSATCAVNDNSRGSVASTGGNYNYLTSITFTAIPNSDYHFLRWSNGSTDNPITFTLTKDTTLTAILVGLTAHVNDNTMGTVSHSKPSNLVEVVTATPNYGYHFVQWNDGNTDNPRTVILTGDTTLTALFAVNNYYLTLASNDSTLGTVQGEGEYAYQSNVTITAIAAEHCHFLHWSDGNTTNPRMLTVTRDTSLTAYFALDQQFQITVGANDTTMGSVEGGGTYFIGETVTLTATANEHYYFSQWSDGMTSNPRVITVTGDMTYTAVFEPVMYTVTVTANDYSMGQVTGGGSYAYGTEVTIEARAFGGYRFICWNDGLQDEQRTVTVTADATYTAIFEQNTGIDDVEAAWYKVYAIDGRIVVEGVNQERVQVFDVIGRKHSLSEQLTKGVYVVRIGERVTKKVVVM